MTLFGCRYRDDKHAASECVGRVPALRTQQPGAVPTRRFEALGRLRNTRKKLGHLLEDDERGRARQGITAVRVRVDVFIAEIPNLLEVGANKQGGRER